MSLSLTPDQIHRLQNLGITVDPDSAPDPVPAVSSASINTLSKPFQNVSNYSPTSSQIKNQSPFSKHNSKLLTPSYSSHSKSKSAILPLLSISGLTIISFGGLVLLKTSTNHDSSLSSPPAPIPSSPKHIPSPTQVPKSIQHYLLASQQYFSQALQLQTNPDKSNSRLVELLNQSILSASQAVNNFPSDYRGYQQRGRIYQSLLDSQPQLLPQAISDFTSASQLNPSSSELTRDLASLYARKGDARNTLAFLTKTVTLEPTKAQNFYDLARLQQQTGQIPQALQTYSRLLSLVSDPDQRVQVENEKSALENLIKQTPPAQKENTIPPAKELPPVLLPDNPPTIQAESGSGLIIAAPETDKSIKVRQLTASNSLSGEGFLPSGQKEITLENSSLTPASQVYLTLTKGGKNKTLQVLSKSNNSFTVGFDSPIPEDASFKWWIIN